MKKIFTYDQLKEIAKETKAELFNMGEFDPSRGKIRKKPRTSVDLDILYERAMERAKRYKPYYDENNKLVLPYFDL
jgi:hypothetical protein